MEPTIETVDKKSNGTLVGSIIIIIILVLGGLYLWTSKMKEVPNTEEQTSMENASAAAIEALDTIEQDMGAEDTSMSSEIENVQ